MEHPASHIAQDLPSTEERSKDLSNGNLSAEDISVGIQNALGLATLLQKSQQEITNRDNEIKNLKKDLRIETERADKLEKDLRRETDRADKLDEENIKLNWQLEQTLKLLQQNNIPIPAEILLGPTKPLSTSDNLDNTTETILLSHGKQQPMPQTIYEESKTDSEEESVKKMLNMILPKVMQTNRAIKYITRAIQREFISVDWRNGKLNWYETKRGGQSQCAYFLGRVYDYKPTVSGNGGTGLREKDIEDIFGVKRIYNTLDRIYNSQNKQSWIPAIDDLFDD